jgi:hypothetical protein
MAHFYGTLQGNRGSASRLGTKASGLVVTAQSWSGSVTVSLWQDDQGNDCVNVRACPGSAPGGETLFSGTVDKLLKRVNRKR